MTSEQGLKQQLLTEIDRLPDHRLGEVLEFVDFLLFKKQATPSKAAALRQHAAFNSHSLQGYAGGATYGSLPQQIDEELYGSSYF